MLLLRLRQPAALAPKQPPSHEPVSITDTCREQFAPKLLGEEKFERNESEIRNPNLDYESVPINKSLPGSNLL
jgi:hypothetical protein